jgi:hypothetical protein
VRGCPQVEVQDLGDQRLGLVDATEAQERDGGIRQQIGAQTAQRAQVARQVGAGEKDLDPLGGAAVSLQDGREVRVGPEQVVELAQLPGDLAALLQVRDALLHMPQDAERRAQRGQRVALDGPVADLPGHGDRLLAPRPHGPMMGRQHEVLAVGGQRARQLPRRRVGGMVANACSMAAVALGLSPASQ